MFVSWFSVRFVIVRIVSEIILILSILWITSLNTIGAQIMVETSFVTSTTTDF